MNRGRISTQVFLCFFVMMFLMVIGCSKSDDPTYNISGAVTGATAVTINLTGDATATTTTDASGNYSFTDRANGTYTVTPVKADYTFNPVSSVAFVSGASVTNTNFVATYNTAPKYIISGTVTGAVRAGVTITLSGATGTTVTNASGFYSFSGLADGDYTVTPSLTGYTFTPANRSITLSGANSTGNFTSAVVVIPTYSISGKVTLSGVALADVTINLTGAANASPTTNAGGNFSITGLYNGAYTVTPVKTGYTFTPSSSAVTLSGADVTNTNFVATITPEHTYSISGTVTGAVLSGVTITLSDAGSATTTTNTSGNYSLPGIVNGNYTVTPSMTGYTFAPSSRAATVSGGDVTVPNFVATANTTTYSQADLTGTWRMNNLRTGSDNGGNKWLRAKISINSSGVATCLSMSDSGGATSCPTSPLDLTVTMNSSTGVITQTGADAADAGTDHMTMTSNKNFIAGTATTTSGSSNPRYQLSIMQKVVPGTSYTNADVQSKSFVYHQLRVGSNNEWEYGTGTTNATGAITITSATMPSGTDTPGAVGTMSLDSNGVVTMSGTDMATFQGFLSDDKKTIVGTATNSGTGWTNYGLMIIQVTGRTYTAGPLPAGISASHMLVGGSTPAPFWLHETVTVDGSGGMTFSNFVTSNGAVTAPAATSGLISASGTVTIAGIPSFHGQVSDDGKFMVGIQTLASGIYGLIVNTQ